MLYVYYDNDTKEIIGIAEHENTDQPYYFSVDPADVPTDISNYKVNSEGDGFEAKNVYAGNSMELTTDATDTESPYDGVPDIPADGTTTCKVIIEIKNPDGSRNTDADCTVILETTGGTLSQISVSVTDGYDDTTTLKSTLETVKVKVYGHISGYEHVRGDMEIQFA